MDVIKKPSKPPRVTISSSGMEAFLTIPFPSDDNEFPQYTVGELLDILNEQKVVYGIDMEAVQEISDLPTFGVKRLVASGEPAEPGVPGNFEFFFSQDFSRQPKIREDGSADFFSIKTVELVHEGQLLATYLPAVQGTQGMTVTGKVIEPRPVRDMPPLSGRGFTRSEDNLHYYAAISGKIVIQNRWILISPVYEISEDADYLTTGNIDFNGDVVIHGGANGGVNIKATGNITIEGLVEVCSIEAGKDVFLLSGVKGKNQTQIRAKGNITAEFVEYVYMEAKGDIQADVIFKSKVDCYGKIQLVGDRAEIIGGYVTAIQGIKAGKVGNDFGTVTHVGVGADIAQIRKIKQLEDKIQALINNVEKIRRGVAEFDSISEKRGVAYREDPRRMELLRIKIRDEASLSENRLILDELRTAADRGKNATVQVRNTIYPGSKVVIGNDYVNIKDEQYQVEFLKSGDNIHMERMEPEELND